MNTEQTSFDQKDSLAVISSMIKQTQGIFQESAFYFILWGSVIALANLVHYILMEYSSYNHPYIVWLITIPAWLASMLYGRKQSRHAIVTTHLDNIITVVWLSFGLSIFLLIILGQAINAYFNPVIMLMAAIPTFISGFTIKEKSLTFGAILFWLAGSVAFFTDTSVHYLIAAIANIGGFLIPGIILAKKRK